MPILKDNLKKIIIENQYFIKDIELIQRDISFEPKANYVFTGPRRAGKTYCLYQIAKNGIQEGLFLPEQILYINFEDERLIELTTQDLDHILESYAELYPHKPVLFLDEIQNINAWEKFARRMADKAYKVYITGSNAKLLSREIATVLGGRFLSIEIGTLTFQEYLTFNGIQPVKHILHAPQRNEVLHHLSQYMHTGGFPELKKFERKNEYLSSVLQKMFYTDIIARYKIKNEQGLKLLLKKLAESVNNETSVNRINNLIKSIGIKSGTATIIDYLGYLEESYFIFSLQNFTARFAEKEAKKKYYFSDTGLLSLYLIEQPSKLFENMVYKALRSKYGQDLYYYKDNVEIDFYIPSQNILIQACYALIDSETFNREQNALKKGMNYLKGTKAIILTFNDVPEHIVSKTKHIQIISFLEFILTINNKEKVV